MSKSFLIDLESRTHQWSATLTVWEINGHKSWRKFQQRLHNGMLVEKGRGPKRTDRLDPTDDRAGRIEGEERNVLVGDDSIKDVQARYGHDRRIRRVHWVPTKPRR